MLILYVVEEKVNKYIIQCIDYMIMLYTNIINKSYVSHLINEMYIHF